MKIFPNLAGSLRFYFGLARVLTVLFVAFWFLTLTLSPWLQKLFVDEPKLMVSVGEVEMDTVPNTVGLSSDTAKPGPLILVGLRGSLRADLLSKDARLVSALRWTMFPVMVVIAVFSWLLFSSLRELCANIERLEVFSENNLRLVRKCGLVLIAYSLAGFPVQLLASRVMDGYLHEVVTMAGLATGSAFPDGKGALHFSIGPFPSEWGLVIGCVILMLSEAFRQGLRLKNENDLTV